MVVKSKKLSHCFYLFDAKVFCFLFILFTFSCANNEDIFASTSDIKKLFVSEHAFSGNSIISISMYLLHIINFDIL